MRSLFSVISVTQTDALRKKTTEIIQNDMASLILFLILVVCMAVLHRGIDSAATTAAAVPAHETCTVSTVTEGEPADMTFTLRSGIDTASKTFFAHLRRTNRKLTDIITCDGLKVSCNVKDGHPMFQVENNIKENILKVRISNMSRELEDTYVLQVYFNGTTEPGSSCILTIDTSVNATLVTDAAIGDDNGSYGWIAAPILVLIAIAILFFFRRKILDWWRPPFAKTEHMSRRNKDEEACNEEEKDPLQPSPKPEQRSPTSDNISRRNKDEQGRDEEDKLKGPARGKDPLQPPPKPEQRSPTLDKTLADKKDKNLHERMRPPIGREQINAHGGMRWFVKNPKEVKVDNLFKYAKPRAGCFVITQTGSSSFMLAVCWKGQGQVDRYYIDQNDSGFTLNNTKEQFQTLSKLVSHYRTTPMRVGENDLGTLSKPCEEDPIKYAWYFGSLTADEVEKLLLANHTEEGSFLVTENVTDKNNYSLSVKFGGKLVPFTIVPQDDGFKISHEKFRTLQNLVEHYTKNVLDGRGKLRKPLEIIPKELTTEERQILEKNGPGSFFYKDSSIPNRRVLAVNGCDKMVQLMIIKSNDGYRLADHDKLHADEVALERYYKTKEITLHGERYGYLGENCTHDLEEEQKQKQLEV